MRDKVPVPLCSISYFSKLTRKIAKYYRGYLPSIKKLIRYFLSTDLFSYQSRYFLIIQKSKQTFFDIYPNSGSNSISCHLPIYNSTNIDKYRAVTVVDQIYFSTNFATCYISIVLLIVIPTIRVRI